MVEVVVPSKVMNESAGLLIHAILVHTAEDDDTYRHRQLPVAVSRSSFSVIM